MDDLISKQLAIDMIHKTIYGFFDVSESEEPISEKDKLLLRVNKAICNGIIEASQDKTNYQVSLTTKEKEFLLDILYNNVDWTCTQIRDGIIKKLHLTSQEP